MIPPIVNFVVLGFLGAIVYVLMWSKSWADVTSYMNIRHIIVGAIIGFMYSFLYSDYGYPNFIMCSVAGYMGPDFIQGILERFKKIGE